jgi:nucleoside-diphosphate-sugar epimerase
VKILITGANGFLGSSICRAALSISNNRVWAALRRGSDLSSIDGLEGINIVYFDYSSNDNLTANLASLYAAEGSFDLIVHNAGLTKSTNAEMFRKVNVELTERLIHSIKKSNLLEYGKFAYVSSQAALGPVGCGGPVSEYGKSKLVAEQIVKQSGLDFLIFRPTGIYGPADKEFLALFKTAKKGLYPCAAPIDQKITLIHVDDVAHNIIELAQKCSNKIIHLSDNNVYSHYDMTQALTLAIGKKILMLRIPMALTKIILSLTSFLGRIFGFEPILTNEKHAEISKDWDHDFSLERKEIPLNIQFNLYEGFANTFAFYKSKNLV